MLRGRAELNTSELPVHRCHPYTDAIHAQMPFMHRCHAHTPSMHRCHLCRYLGYTYGGSVAQFIARHPKRLGLALLALMLLGVIIAVPVAITSSR